MKLICSIQHLLLLHDNCEKIYIQWEYQDKWFGQMAGSLNFQVQFHQEVGNQHHIQDFKYCVFNFWRVLEIFSVVLLMLKMSSV